MSFSLCTSLWCTLTSLALPARTEPTHACLNESLAVSDQSANTSTASVLYTMLLNLIFVLMIKQKFISKYAPTVQRATHLLHIFICKTYIYFTHILLHMLELKSPRGKLEFA